jgi:hypothetical protein
MKQQGRLADWNLVLADHFGFDRRDHRRRDSVRRLGGAWSFLLTPPTLPELYFAFTRSR